MIVVSLKNFYHNPANSVVGLNQTKVLGGLTKVLYWYDNQWGFSNRMLVTTISWMTQNSTNQSAA
ncbi:MAG: hypothetical protein CMD87_03780 [Gammaproteobacteria bacterium]|nr:hypothetical protein [Gammaproteobacteria bacterium]